MEPLLQKLGTMFETLGDIEALPYPEVVQRWVVQNIIITVGLLKLVQMRADESSRFDSGVIARFLADKQLKDRLAWLVKDAANQHGNAAMLQCFLRHEATFTNMGSIFRAALPSGDVS